MSKLGDVRMGTGYFGKEECEYGVKEKRVVSLGYGDREIQLIYYMVEGKGRLGPYEAQILRHSIYHDEDKVAYLFGEGKKTIKESL